MQNAIAKIKRASVEDYQPYYGTEEDAPETPTGGEDPDKPSETEIDDMEKFEKQEAL